MKKLKSGIINGRLMTILFALVTCLTLSKNSSAAVFVVTAQGMTFAPNIVNCTVGDTIKWEWVNGTHTTTSTSVPSGAGTWSQSLDAISTSYIYVISQPGTYSYQCNYHYTMGMVGTINATSATGIRSVKVPGSVSVYPNPVSKELYININTSAIKGPAVVSVIDILGREMSKQNIDMQGGQNTFMINMEPLKSGTYFVHFAETGKADEIFKIEKE